MKTQKAPVTCRNRPPTVDPLALVPRQLSFIERIIEKTLVKQPPWIQAIVLIVFVFLFVYMVVFTTQGSIVLSTQIRIPDPKNASAASVPDSGYQVAYDYRYYGLNSQGQVRIDLTLPNYFWAALSRKLQITVRPPGALEYQLPVSFNGLDLETIIFGKAENAALGVINVPWQFGTSPTRSSLIDLLAIDRAKADTVSGLRLYVQSVAASNKFDAAAVTATLTVGNDTKPLLAFSNGYGSAAQSPLLVKGGISLVQNYESFFALAKSPSGGRITLQAPSTLFTNGVTEIFYLPDLSIGVPVSLTGNAGGKLVVQLAYPVDVVFFERRDTLSVTEKLFPRIALSGYVPRINPSTTRLAGEYNAIYSGDEVPNSALKAVIKIISSNGIHLRSIQPQRHLANGIQNHIQIGSNDKAACLPVISDEKLQALNKANDNDFRMIANETSSKVCQQ